MYCIFFFGKQKYFHNIDRQSPNPLNKTITETACTLRRQQYL